ncbi:hypothetical protein Q9L58_000921 [Maublancomyces gigas]|uniref:Microsomal glutathione S-transferase 3 n=1 Tax=Discina gigas TaxID=1032678 RepID=A0ABR3GVW6_9PEZI
MASITVTPEHGYVLGVLALTGFVAQWHAFLVGPARKASKVAYPNAYATHEEAEKDASKFAFNCVQRAHANYLENLAVIIPLIITSGPLYPKTTASLGGVWIAGRIMYALGYKGSKPGSAGNGRYRGAFYAAGQLGLMITAGLSVWTYCVPGN